MYYVEKIIDNVLHYQTTPDGEWKPLTPEELTQLLIHEQWEVIDLKKEIERLNYTIKLMDINTNWWDE
jgi:hypothetical protein